ncbi:MAG: mannitol dehydrogenase family protein [Lachnospiraceae bacterium]|nr:mannitol dehydrogenase family protein [Lachnospiraceae bacterium]
MKLTLEGISNRTEWAGFKLPNYDIPAMCEDTKNYPVWMHFGSGNIFRAFLCCAAQELLDKNIMKSGITAAESHGTEIITECFRPHDNLCVAVTLNGDGSTDKEIVASVGEALTTEYDFARIREIFTNPSLQMVSFTITEKGYALRNAAGELSKTVAADMAAGPEKILEHMTELAAGDGHCVGAHHLMSVIAALCLERAKFCGKPIALVSMDNCSHNGEKIENAIREISGGWLAGGLIGSEEVAYLQNKVSYPWSMIDKITPRPDAKVEAMLIEDGIDDVKPFVTPNGTYIAPFVNAERPQYLIIEDDFPNGRPALDKARGIIFTDRDTVNACERMKVCTCLNPLHTALAIYGCLLGYTSISEEMKDPQLKGLITKMALTEGMPVVVNPGIIDPKAFLDECLNERFPNPFMPDTPQRIATDTSQKLPIRYGENFKAHIEKGDADTLIYMPLVIAGWLRYLMAVDDNGDSFTPSADPMLQTARGMIGDVCFGDTDISEDRLTKLLSNEVIFGTDLAAAGLGPIITGYFNELNAGVGAVRKTLKKYVG